MLVADRQGRILKPGTPPQDAGGGGRPGGCVVGEEFVLKGGWVGFGCGEKGWLLGRIGRDESCPGGSWLWAKMRSYPRMWNLVV